jgi:GNAT superfamily N-acetyltransferase
MKNTQDHLQMDAIQTKWPEVEDRLAGEVCADPYVRWHLKQALPWEAKLHVLSRRKGRDVMRTYEAPYGLEVWLEAQTDDARLLLRCLPLDRELFVSLGTSRGLDLTQQEVTGRVTGFSLFCMTERHRLRPVDTHHVTRLTQADRDALRRYPPAPNRDSFFQSFDEGKVDLWGCYEHGEIVGYAAAFCGDMSVAWVDVTPDFRGRGYGGSLLSACAMDLLREHEVVLYDACLDEMANARLCLSVGFVPLRLMSYFTGKRVA